MSLAQHKLPLLEPIGLPNRKVIPLYYCIYIYEEITSTNGTPVLVAVLQSYRRICTQEEQIEPKEIIERPDGSFAIDNTLAVRILKNELFLKIKEKIFITGRCKIRAMGSLFANRRLVFMDESHLSPEISSHITLKFYDSIEFVIIGQEPWEQPTLGLAEIFPDLINLKLIFVDI